MVEQNKALVRRYYEMLDKGDMDAIAELFAEDILWRFSGMGALDKKGIEGLIQGFRTAFPDMRHTLDAQTAEGDWVTTPLTFTATHKGDMMGVPPPGKRVDVRGINVHRVVEGKIVEAETVVDMLGLMQQIGAIPVPGQSSA
ncbi:MAG: ester cyclase [Gemmatimonadales bacterium]